MEQYRADGDPDPFHGTDDMILLYTDEEGSDGVEGAFDVLSEYMDGRSVIGDTLLTDQDRYESSLGDSLTISYPGQDGDLDVRGYADLIHKGMKLTDAMEGREEPVYILDSVPALLQWTGEDALFRFSHRLKQECGRHDATGIYLAPVSFRDDPAMERLRWLADAEYRIDT